MEKTEDDINKLIEEGFDSIEKLVPETGVTAGCGACRFMIQKMIENNKKMATIIGMTSQEAEGELVKQGYVVRVVKIDGNSFPITAEFMLNRMNLIVENGLVVRTYVG